MTLDHPLRLATGSHQKGSGTGCAMNVISWENGDATITDQPDCADPVLARIVQRVNDKICTHRDKRLLCPECSMKVLTLAHRTVGTGGPLDRDRHRVWVRVATDQARQVLHLAKPRTAAEAAIVAAETWADDPREATRISAHDAANLAMYSAIGAEDPATLAAASATRAAVTGVRLLDVIGEIATGDTYLLTLASSFAASSNQYAATALYAQAGVHCDVFNDDFTFFTSDIRAATDAVAAEWLALAHRAVDRFIQLTDHVEQQPDEARTRAAIDAMVGSR